MSDSVLTIDKVGNKFWRNSKRQIHRTDGPAIESIAGRKEWWENNRLHRLNGPAIMYTDGTYYWYVNGEYLEKNDKGFWVLWDRLTPEQKKDPILLSHLPEKF